MSEATKALKYEPWKLHGVHCMNDGCEQRTFLYICSKCKEKENEKITIVP